MRRGHPVGPDCRHLQHRRRCELRQPAIGALPGVPGPPAGWPWPWSRESLWQKPSFANYLLQGCIGILLCNSRPLASLFLKNLVSFTLSQGVCVIRTSSFHVHQKLDMCAVYALPGCFRSFVAGVLAYAAYRMALRLVADVQLPPFSMLRSMAGALHPGIGFLHGSHIHAFTAPRP